MLNSSISLWFNRITQHLVEPDLALLEPCDKTLLVSALAKTQGAGRVGLVERGVG